MDASSFDRRSRLAAVSSRRAVATGLGGAIAGLLGGMAPVAAARCKKGQEALPRQVHSQTELLHEQPVPAGGERQGLRPGQVRLPQHPVALR